MTNNSFSIRLREARLMMKLSMDVLYVKKLSPLGWLN